MYNESLYRYFNRCEEMENKVMIKKLKHIITVIELSKSICIEKFNALENYFHRFVFGTAAICFWAAKNVIQPENYVRNKWLPLNLLNRKWNCEWKKSFTFIDVAHVLIILQISGCWWNNKWWNERQELQYSLFEGFEFIENRLSWLCLILWSFPLI